MQKKYILIIVVILLSMFVISTIALSSGGWIIYYESAFEGKVIDAETKEPIEGAVVVAIYKVSVYGFFHSGSAGVDVQETLTNSNGEFHISSNIFFYPWPFSGGERTRFIIFKPGYGPYPGYNTSLFIQLMRLYIFQKVN